MIKEKLKEYLKNNKGSNRYVNLKKNSEYINFLKTTYPTLDIVKDLKDIICLFENELLDFPKCINPECSNKTHRIATQRIAESCSKSCAVRNKAVRGEIDEILEKKKETWIKKYGVDNPSKSKLIMDKITKTNLEKYGETSPAKNKEVQEKIKQTNLEKYGTEWFMGTDYFYEKSKTTIKEKYGVDNVFKSENIKDKIKQTTLERYGVEYIGQSEEAQEKTRETIKRKSDPYVYEILNNPDSFGREFKNCFESTIIMADRFKVSTTLILSRLKKFNIDNPSKNKSSYEYHLEEILQSYEINFISNDRTILKPKELDFYFPDNKFALEINGLKWHGERKLSNRNIHHDKWKACNDLGITLFSINEDEWNHKKDFWINKILYQLGKIEVQKIYARKCEVREISDKKIIYEFLENYHLQGKTQFSKGIGLYYDDELISVMTFGNTRDNKKDVIDLSRFCSMNDIQVIGGASKLLKYFIKKYGSDYKEIVSFSDNRYSNGKVYETLGFEFVNELKPDYRYFNNSKCLTQHKASFRKSSIQKKFNLDPDYVANKTEWELMLELGYDRIWDCGKKKWSMKI